MKPLTQVKNGLANLAFLHKLLSPEHTKYFLALAECCTGHLILHFSSSLPASMQ